MGATTYTCIDAETAVAEVSVMMEMDPYTDEEGRAWGSG